MLTTTAKGVFISFLVFYRFGFHWPPFNSITHLHLHAIAPVSEMSLTSRIIFKEGTLWFVSVSLFSLWFTFTNEMIQLYFQFYLLMYLILLASVCIEKTG